jgi:hypothetical protein
MGKTVNLIVLGFIAAGLMLVAKIGLMRLNLPHYDGVIMSGREGLKVLGVNMALGAGFAIVYGFLVRPILPGGAILAALIFSIVPFIFFAMAWPMYRGGAMMDDSWHLLYMELELFIFSLALVLLGKGGGGGKSKE